ncbi:M15 family metallopeptidase [Nocardia sp. NRRL S-836]|uniref:M15 family metallopeptidase n=1 Tax=Nocardia sp. NRRL S-836 TaxID=1519492 RepID=UPI000A650B5B|nr:M15 family metallopeptidase [Nocardia sp. NRRL S-836]
MGENMELEGVQVGRRTVLRAGAGAAAVAAAASLLPAVAFAAPEQHDPLAAKLSAVRSGELSANGWEVEKGFDIGGGVWLREVQGTGFSVPLRIGLAQALLHHVIRRYHYSVGTLRPGDVVGFLPHDRRQPAYQSNHASGTAVDIRPGAHPVGTRELFPAQLTAIRSILNECRGLVAWGGDFRVPDQAHFQIAVKPGDKRLATLVESLAGFRY